MSQFDDCDIIVRGASREQIITKVEEGYLEDLELFWANELFEEKVEEWAQAGEAFVVISEESPVWESLVDELSSRIEML